MNTRCMCLYVILLGLTITVFDLITAPWVFQKYWGNMYPPKGTLKNQQRTYVCNDAYAMLCVCVRACVRVHARGCVCVSSDCLYKSICYGYSFELHGQVDAIQMDTHNICLYKEVDKKYTGYNLKTTELFDCALIGVCAAIRSNTVA